jgi:hypothetical protein
MDFYRIRFKGEKLDLEDLAHSFPQGRWKINEDAEGFYLDVKHEHSGLEGVRSEAEEFIHLVNGGLNLIHGDAVAISINHIEKVSQDGSRVLFLEFEDGMQARSRAYATVNCRSQGDQASQLEIWLKKAEKHSSVRDVLHFFSEKSWWNLYKIYEIISEDIQPKNKIYEIVSKRELSLFTQTANSRTALGDHARHATESTSPPVKKMVLDEAHNLIAQLFRGWLVLKD